MTSIQEDFDSLSPIVRLTGRTVNPRKHVITAHLADGTAEVVRTSTRPYLNGFVYRSISGNSLSGWGPFMSYGKAPTGHRGPVVATFLIEWAS